jgi:hypothetical protein
MAIVMFLNTGSALNSIMRRLSGRNAMPPRRARVVDESRSVRPSRAMLPRSAGSRPNSVRASSS